MAASGGGAGGDPPKLDDVAKPGHSPNPPKPKSLVPLFQRQREWVRTIIALALLTTLVGMVIAYSWVFLAGGVQEAGLKEVLAGLFTPILGVFGTVTGFYYGTHASDTSG